MLQLANLIAGDASKHLRFFPFLAAKQEFNNYLITTVLSLAIW